MLNNKRKCVIHEIIKIAPFLGPGVRFSKVPVITGTVTGKLYRDRKSVSRSTRVLTGADKITGSYQALAYTATLVKNRRRMNWHYRSVRQT